jgi:hypothetical protein
MKDHLKHLTCLLFAALLVGCSKDPAEPDKTPVISNITLTDSLYAYLNYSYHHECVLSATLAYSIQNYSFIRADSDSEELTIYLHNSKIISGLAGNSLSIYREYDYAKDEKTKAITGLWMSDTTAYALRADDTLSNIDSSVVNIWWWYKNSRKDLHYKI